jgi:sulfur carrier protein
MSQPQTVSQQRIVVNGDEQSIPAGCTVERLLELMGMAGRRVAVAIDHEVIPRSHYAQTGVASGDQIEILEAVGGG